MAAALGTAGRLGMAACVSRLGRPRPPGKTLLAAALVLPIVLWLDKGAFVSDPEVRPDGHAAVSVELAVNRHVFGNPSAIIHYKQAPTTIRAMLANGSAGPADRLLDLPDRLAGSAEEYARKQQPFLNNENSLVLLDYALLCLKPDLTLAGLRQAQVVVKVGCLSAFAVFLLWIGFSPLLVGAALHLGLLIVAQLTTACPLGVYPLLAPVLLLYVALLGSALASGMHHRLWAVPALLAAGVAAGFLCNLRTSYAPLAAVLLLLYTVVAALDLRRGGARFWRVALLGVLGLVAFGGGYRLFSAACIDPIKEAGADAWYSYAHHAIGHPLVLALAQPPNDLAKREGITYDDACGKKLARRIDPTVRYLDARYDTALLTYYARLWLYYPDEMRQLYAAKLDTAGVDCFRYLNDLAGKEDKGGAPGLGRLSRWLRWPLGGLPRGRQWLLALAVLAALGTLAGRWLGPAAAFTVAGLAATAALLLLEATAVLATFYLQYQSLLLFCVLLAGLVPYQLGVDGAVWIVALVTRQLRSPVAESQKSVVLVYPASPRAPSLPAPAAPDSGRVSV
jgi:hypothetical protein